MAWAKAHKRDRAHSHEEMDKILAAYIESLYWAPEGTKYATKQEANNLLAAYFLYRPAARHFTCEARKCVKAWEKQKPSKQRPPYTQGLARLLAFLLVQRGRPSFAIAVLLSFDCLLRVGEAFSLRVGDVTLDTPTRPASIWIREAKTGLEQSVEVVDWLTLKALRWWMETLRKKGVPAHLPLFSGNPAMALDLMKKVLEAVGVREGLTTHSLRHGGATLLKLIKPPWTFEDIKLRGRWKSDGACKRYLQPGRALRMAKRLPRDVKKFADMLEQNPDELARLFDF